MFGTTLNFLRQKGKISQLLGILSNEESRLLYVYIGGYHGGFLFLFFVLLGGGIDVDRGAEGRKGGRKGVAR